jgi:hypothetical protein
VRDPDIPAYYWGYGGDKVSFIEPVTTPSPIHHLSGIVVTQIASGISHTVFLTDLQTLYSYGEVLLS